MTITGLVRVTVVTPQRRIDLALPEQVSVAEVVPGLLGKAGEHLADEGVPDGGWALRRADGKRLDLGLTIGAHRIRDGEILHLVPRRTDWPELEYDDLVDAVANGSGRLGSAWGNWHTRMAGLTLSAAAISLGLVAVWWSGMPVRPGSRGGTPEWSLLVAAVLLVAGVLLARAVGDSDVGALLGVLSMPYAWAGGGLLLAGDRAVTELGAPHLLTASAMLMLVGTVGLVGIVDHAAWFVTAIFGGLVGVVAGWLATADALDAADVAALVGGTLLICTPALPPLALRLGRVPTPTLPRTTADLVRDDPQPPRPAVYAAVLRADGLLTGMLGATCLAIGLASIVLVESGGNVATAYVGLLIAGSLLRARSYAITKQRVMLFGAAAIGAGSLAVGRLVVDAEYPLASAVPVLVLVAAILMLCGLRYSTRLPSPYLGRSAELLEVAVILGIIPMACWVLGLYGLARGWGG
ncbi:type VII secretion integral membrane protein EccD [Actinomycetes bacterium KLBMP 9797]